LRTYKAVAYRVGQAEAAATQGEIFIQRGFLGRALDAFSEARVLARELKDLLVECAALRGSGDVYRQRGQLAHADELYTEARALTSQLHSDAQTSHRAELDLRQARVALLRGELDRASQELATARQALGEQQRTSDLWLQSLLTEGQLLLVIGDTTQAARLFAEARQQAEALQQPLLAVQALLNLGTTHLVDNDLETANATYLEAGHHFQLLESSSGDGSAMLGVCQTLIGREQWDEAIEDGNGALLRFNQADDQLGRADAELALGLAYRGKEAMDEALKHLDEALTLYQQQPQPLGEIDVRNERAGIFLNREELQSALAESERASTLIQRILATLSQAEQRRLFLRQYSEFYAQKALILARLQRDSEAQTDLNNFARIAGSDQLKLHLQAFEDSIPVQDTELTESQLAENQALLKRVKQLRKGL
jgi:hypothetical protein